MTRRRWLPFISIVGGVACALVLAELSLRTFYVLGRRYELEFTRYSLLFKRPGAVPDLPFEHRANQLARLMGTTVRTNAEGLRSGPVSVAKPADTFRVACVGDSLTFGWGVEEADTYCEQLATRLSVPPLRASQKRAEAVNFGVGNYNTAMELAVLRHKVFAYEPDLIVLQYYINDAEPTPAHAREPLVAHSYLAVFLLARSDLVLRAMGMREDYVRYYRRLYAEPNPGLQPFRMAIREFAEECRVRGRRLVVLIFPELHRLDAGEPFQDIYRQVQGWWQAEGVSVINLWGPLAGRDPRELWVHPADVHPNARVHGLAAAAVEALLRRSGDRAPAS